MRENDLHKLKIENGELTLDGFKIKGLTGYETKKSSASSPTELVLKIEVEDMQLTTSNQLEPC